MRAPQRHGGPALLLLIGVFAAALGFLLGTIAARRNVTDFSVITGQAADAQALAQGGDTAEAGSDAEQAAEADSYSDPDTDTLIDLNHADAETLQQLPGIGPERAQAIVQYREENGLFVTIDEVKNVPGIGEGIFEQIRDYITVDYR